MFSEWVPHQYTLYRSTSLVVDITGRLFYHVSEHNEFIILFKKPPSDRISWTGAGSREHDKRNVLCNGSSNTRKRYYKSLS